MAHFAELNETNIVTNVIVVNNTEILDENGIESESKGIQFCKDLYGQETRWIQTSYNASFRKHYAGIGFIYDEQKDAFIPPKIYPSWILNEKTFLWEPPIPYPNDGYAYYWDFENEQWVLRNPENT